MVIKATNIYICIRLPVTRWVKLNLNFELLEEDFLFYIYCQIIDLRLNNKIKDKFSRASLQRRKIIPERENR